MSKNKWFLLQLFAGEGSGAGASGSGAGGESGSDGTTGDNGLDAGAQRLRELGQMPGHGALLTPLAREILEGKS